jgi:regulator of replication initiation timing
MGDLRVQMQHTIKSMKSDIDEVKSQIKSVTTVQNVIINKMTDEMSTLRQEINVVTIANCKLEATNHDLSDRLNR